MQLDEEDVVVRCFTIIAGCDARLTRVEKSGLAGYMRLAPSIQFTLLKFRFYPRT